MTKHNHKTTAILLATIALSLVAMTIYISSPVAAQSSTQQSQDLSQDRVGRMIIGGQIASQPTLTTQQANTQLHNS